MSDPIAQIIPTALLRFELSKDSTSSYTFVTCEEQRNDRRHFDEYFHEKRNEHIEQFGVIRKFKIAVHEQRRGQKKIDSMKNLEPLFPFHLSDKHENQRIGDELAHRQDRRRVHNVIEPDVFHVDRVDGARRQNARVESANQNGLSAETALQSPELGLALQLGHSGRLVFFVEQNAHFGVAFGERFPREAVREAHNLRFEHFLIGKEVFEDQVEFSFFFLQKNLKSVQAAAYLVFLVI